MSKSFVKTALVALISIATTYGSIAASAQDRPSQIPAEAFAARPDVSSVSLSPSGDAIGMVVNEGENRFIILQNLDGSDPQKIAGKAFLYLQSFQWVNNDAIVIFYAYYGSNDARKNAAARTKLYSFHRSTEKFKKLVTPSGPVNYEPRDQANIIDYLPNDKNHILVSLAEEGSVKVGVQKIDIRDGSKKRAGEAVNNAINYFSGPDHVIRLATSWQNAPIQTDFLFKLKGKNGKWVDVKNNSWLKDYTIIDFADDINTLYVHGKSATGTMGIYKLDIPSGQIIETVNEDPNLDVTRLIVDAYNGEAIGTQVVDNGVQEQYFDDSYNQVQAALSAKLKGFDVSIIDRSRDGSTYLASFMTSQHPKNFMVYKPKTDSMSLVAKSNTSLSPKLLTPRRPLSYTARDGEQIQAYLSIPLATQPRKLPTIIMPHNGPNKPSIDTFDPITQFLASRGYLIFEPKVRHGDNAGLNRYDPAHLSLDSTLQRDIADGANWLIEQGLADPARICVVDRSFGGYAALLTDIEKPGILKCGASLNGYADRGMIGWGISGTKKSSMRTGSFRTTFSRLRMMKKKDESNISAETLANGATIPMLLISAQLDTYMNSDKLSALNSELKKMKKDSTFVDLDNDGLATTTAKSRKKALEVMEKFLAKHIGN